MKIKIAVFSWILVLSSYAFGSPKAHCSNLLTFYSRDIQFVRTPFFQGQAQNYTSMSQSTLPTTFRFGTYNVLNLFEHSPRSDKAYSIDKDPRQLAGNAQVIKDINPDFQILVEIESLNALSRFNELYLGGKYEPFLIDGNDSRGIHIGLLVKRDLPIQLQWRSYKDYSSSEGHPLFARDLPVGLVYDKTQNKKPLLAIIGVHLKSRRVAPGQTTNTAEIRRKEVAAAADIIKNLRDEFGQDLNFVLAGDLNTPVHSSPELTQLFQLGFKDTLDLIPNPLKQRPTHFFFPRDGEPTASQIDGILVLSKTAKVKAAMVYPDKDSNGKPLPAPISYEDRQTRPSDHRAIGAEISF